MLTIAMSNIKNWVVHITRSHCRAGNGVRMTEKPFVQGMGWENPS